MKGICDRGLDIKKGSSVLATISSLGVSSELKSYQRKELKDYRLGSEMAEYGVVALVPTILEGNGERIFNKNMNHFIEMTDEEKGNFIKKISDRLTEQQKQISEAVITGDMQRLEQLSIEMCGDRDGVLGENTVIQNAMFYLNRNIEQAEQSGNNVKSDIRKSKRRILLDAYQDVKLSDLAGAKETLREGIEQPQKNYEGKEI